MTHIYLCISSNVCGEVKIQNSTYELNLTKVLRDSDERMFGQFDRQNRSKAFLHGFLSPNYNILYVFLSCHPCELFLTRKMSQSSDGNNLKLSCSTRQLLNCFILFIANMFSFFFGRLITQTRACSLWFIRAFPQR